MQLSKTLFLFLLFSFSINAQKFELGKVSVAELEQKEHPKDPSAPAAVLFEKGEVKFEYSQNEGFVMITKVRRRIKIYKKEGYDWATKEIRYYQGKNKEKIDISDAATYNLEQGKVVKSKLKSDGEFDEKINKYWNNKKITLPNIKEGSIVEYEYKVISPSVGKIRDWAFQTSIPVNYSEFVTYIPEYFVYSANQKGSLFPKVTVDKFQRSIVFNEKERTDGKVVETHFSSSKIDYEETVQTYVMENVPAMKEEAFVNNINNYTSSISQELSMTKFPRVPFKSFATDWATVTKTIYEFDDFGDELTKTGYYEADIDALVKGIKERDDIINAIFSYVKSNIKWNGFTGYSCNDGVRAAYKNKTGNAAEINLMLTSMLRHAGIDANPVLISTRSNGISFFPNLTAFNYVIAAVEIQNDLILLDATDKFALPNVLPSRDLNWYGRLVRKDGTSSEVDLMPKKLSKEITYMTAVLKNDGSASGKIRRQYTDHTALAYRQKSVGVSNENYIEELENKSNAIEISEYVRENEQEVAKPVIESYAFNDKNAMEIINDKIYVNPLFFFSTKENPFKQEKREYPVDFGNPFEKKYNISIEIPEGYVVETLPKAANLITGDDIGAFKYAVGSTDNKIQITLTSDINTAIVSADYYDVLKDFYQKMIDKQNEKIVLVKKL